MKTRNKHVLKHDTKCRQQSLEFLSLSHLGVSAETKIGQKNEEKIIKKCFWVSAK